jgi:hypothetical protein
MAPKIILIIILLLFVFSLSSLLFLLMKFKKLSLKVRFYLLLGLIIFSFYSFHSFKQLIHYNTVKNIDTFYLSNMFEEYFKKYDKLPRTYNDLKSATKNLHVLIEKDFIFIKPNISFMIDSTSNDQNIIVKFYEYGFNKKDDKLNKTIESPFSVFGLFINGDFYISTKEFQKRRI